MILTSGFPFSLALVTTFAPSLLIPDAAWIPLPESMVAAVQAIRFLRVVIAIYNRVKNESFSTFLTLHLVGNIFVAAESEFVIVVDVETGFAVWAFEIAHDSSLRL